jgi:hypothetical protein
LLSAQAVATTGASNKATETPYRPSLCRSVARSCSGWGYTSKTQQLPSQLPVTTQASPPPLYERQLTLCVGVSLASTAATQIQPWPPLPLLSMAPVAALPLR